MNAIKNKKRISLILAVVVSMLLAMPMAVFATEAPEGGGMRNTIQVEYRYAEGETVDVPAEIDRFGFTYHLVSQAPAVLESTLADTRTYTFRIEGLLTPAQIASISSTAGITLTPQYIVKEREVDKEVQIPMRTNDVDDVPMTMLLQVTSGTDPSGFEMKALDRAGITFELANPPLDKFGLPAGYVAYVVYRGVETYSEVGYYSGQTTFTTTEESSTTTPIYVIVAEYETEVILPPIDEEEEEIVEQPAEGIGEESTTEEDAELVAMVENQTGNPFLDIASGNVPLGNGSITGVWSLLSLLFSAAGIVIALISALGALARRRQVSTLEQMGASKEEWFSLMKRRGVILRVLTILVGVITLITWLVIDDFSLGMVWINGYTIFIGIMFAITVALCILTNIRDKKIYSSLTDEEEHSEGFATA